jgi:hypothetical protein
MFTKEIRHTAAIRIPERARNSMRIGQCVVRPCTRQGDQRVVTISNIKPLLEAMGMAAI